MSVGNGWFIFDAASCRKNGGRCVSEILLIFAGVLLVEAVVKPAFAQS